MPTQITYSIQRSVEPGGALEMNNGLYEYLGFGKTPFHVSMISRGAHRKIISTLDETWQLDDLALLELTIDANKTVVPQVAENRLPLEQSEVLNFSDLDSKTHKQIVNILTEDQDYREIKVYRHYIITMEYSGIEKLHANPNFSHIKAFIYSAPLPIDDTVIINFMVITDPTIIIDVINLSNVGQTILINSEPQRTHDHTFANDAAAVQIN